MAGQAVVSAQPVYDKPGEPRIAAAKRSSLVYLTPPTPWRNEDEIHAQDAIVPMGVLQAATTVDDPHQIVLIFEHEADAPSMRRRYVVVRAGDWVTPGTLLVAVVARPSSTSYLVYEAV